MAVATHPHPTAPDVTMVTLCACHCGQPVTAGREFRQGHDQRLRGRLLQTLRDQALHHQKRSAAKRALQSRGWLPKDA